MNNVAIANHDHKPHKIAQNRENRLIYRKARGRTGQTKRSKYHLTVT